MRSIGTKKEVILKTIGYTALFFCIFGFTSSPLGVRLNAVALDSLRVKDVSSDAVILAIDDATLQTLGAWPLDRAVYASLIKILEGYSIKGLIFDVLFLEEKPKDEVLRNALAESTYPIVLGIKQTEVNITHSVFQQSGLASEGVVNVSPDHDGKVRAFASPYKDSTQCIRPLFLALFPPPQNESSCSMMIDKRFIYPRNVPTFSFSDVLSGKVPKEVLQGKVIFVGATTLDLEDYFVGLDGTKIPGVSVHAGMYSSYFNSLFTTPLYTTSAAALMIALIFLGNFLVHYVRSPMRQILLLACSGLFLILVTIWAFDLSKELPLISLLLSLIGSFVLSTLFHYAISRKENALIKGMFSRYVNKEVLRELLNNPKGKGKTQKQYVSILFSDLRGFTDFSETLEPEDLTRLLNAYFSKMVAEIFKESGTVDKFIGDAVMAFWNAPLPTQHHEYHAVRSAIGMQEALRTFNQEQETCLKMGIGIHAGFAVIGNVGGSERVSYTALGDSVNTASRLEAITKTYGVGIIISKEVAEVYSEFNVDGAWRVRKLDEVRLKGRQKSTLLFEVTALSQESIAMYEKALSLYQKSKFDEALDLLSSYQLSEDGPSTLLKKRISGGRIKEGWDGVWVFDEK